MRKYFSKALTIAMIAIIFLLQACVKDKLTKTYTYFEPVYQNKAEVLNAVKSSPAQALQATGKLVMYGNYIFLNEINKGIHVIDNSNPADPKNISFINIPGNQDIAIKNNSLYADIFTDVLTIDITDLDHAVLKKVISGIFIDRILTNGTYDSTKYITSWTQHTTNSEEEFKRLTDKSQSLAFATAQPASANLTGTGGSMARFAIVNNYLYTVGRNNLTSFNITNTMDPVKEFNQILGTNIETIYPFNGQLFIGAQTGMLVYNLNNPARPAFQENFSHACFNDPVIADAHYAYVTLRARTEVSGCWGVPLVQRNELDIVDVNNLHQAFLQKVYPMTEPKGLSKDGDFLFICDGSAGLKIYNAANVNNLQLIKEFTGLNTFDVIAQTGNAIVVAENGLYQYNYSDINNIKLVSKINISR
ncbi:MAG: hypothetical protein ABJA78_05285 [Ferruginibacter sp.]